ncbi:hypothetical protein [Streptomyces sp. NPDC006739]|uniref:hypothetical protein n=1 Tax=Streptomyces sp. NPDC006739 TaxID=3364763 RepID=UPI003679DA6C
MSTPYERLMAEAIPTKPTPPLKRDRALELPGWWTPQEQAQHLADMLAALDGWVWDEEQRDEERRHLRLLNDDAA